MINLLPVHIKEEHRYGRKNVVIVSWLTTVIFGVIILFLVAIVGRLTIDAAKDQELTRKNAIQKELDDSDYASIEKNYADYVGDLTSVSKIYQKQVLYSRLIRKLGTLLPPGSSLSSISIGEDDKAISLNFNNEQDLLGPTIQLNLSSQGEETAKRIARIFPYDISKAGNDPDGITVDSENQKISFYTNIAGEATINKLKDGLVSGGDFSRFLAKPALENAGYYENEASAKIIGETVNTSSKYVDYQIAANTKQDAEKIAAQLLAQPTSFIETYVYLDPSSYRGNGCKTSDGKTQCAVTCATANDCGVENLICTPTTDKGCRWIARGYYDEVLSTGVLEQADEDIARSCSLSGRPCTHKVSFSYTQMFDKVDIIRVAGCANDSTTNKVSCPVEVRAEFSKDAKFYLISEAR